MVGIPAQRIVSSEIHIPDELDPEDEDFASPQRGDLERNYQIFCDESGVHGAPWTGFGSFWIPRERRGTLQELRHSLAHRFGARTPSEVKWTKVKPFTLPYFEALTDAFFQRRWMMFHCLVIPNTEVDLSLHEHSRDLQRRKHLSMFLANKVRRFAAAGTTYSIRVDPIHSSYKKADEELRAVLKNLIAQDRRLHGLDVLRSVWTVNSRLSFGVQLSDLFVGAVVAARNGETTCRAKSALMRRIAGMLGWEDLAGSTFPRPAKFNIWRFEGKLPQGRRERARPTAFDHGALSV